MSKLVLNGEVFDLRGPVGPDGNPIGTVINFMGLKAPKDYLICDGSVYKISDYPNLAKFFKDQFGSETYFGGSDGTFAVPDMRNLFLRGYGGEADDALSGNIGKKQNGTVFPYIGGTSLSAILISAEALKTSNVDTSTLGVGAGRRIIKEDSSQNDPYNYNFTARPVNMAVLYCIKAVDSRTVYETIEEYDATVDGCQWRVRKWSNGYCELFGAKSYTGVSITVSAGGIFATTSAFSSLTLPITLVDNYTQQLQLVESSQYCWLIPSTPSGGTLLTRTPKIGLYSYRSFENVSLSIKFYVTGRWKEKTIETAERITSEVLPRTSGTITKGGKQYDYELPENVVASGSSAASFNGIGSSAKI